MTEAEPSSNGAEEIDTVKLNLSQDEAPALIQKLNESPEETTQEIPDSGIDPKNAAHATEDSSTSENIKESEIVTTDVESNTSSGKDLHASESMSSLEIPVTYQSSEVHEVTTEDDPHSIINEESRDEDIVGKESENADSHEKPSEIPFGGADEIASSTKGAKVFPEADPTESTEVAANQEEKVLSSSEQDDNISIKEIHVIPENVLTELAEENSNAENEHMSSVNPQSLEANELNSSEAETMIETLENEENVTSLNKEASLAESDETAADPEIQDPLNNRLVASNDVKEPELSEIENITINEQEISNSNQEVDDYEFDPIEIMETSTPLEDEGARNADRSIPGDVVNPTRPHELAETALADEQSSTSSEYKAEVSEGHPTGSMEAAEKQEAEVEISAELSTPASGPEDASKKALLDEHDVTSFTEETDRTVIVEASEKDETEADSSNAQPISEEANQPIISHEDQSEKALPYDQDIRSSSPEDEIFQMADLTATSDAAEKQDVESDSLEEQSISLDVINPTVCQVDAPLLDGHDITEHSQEVEISQEDDSTVGAEPAEKHGHEVDSSVDIAISDLDNTIATLPHEDLLENPSPDEHDATNFRMEGEISNEADKSGSLEATEKEQLEADSSAEQLISEETTDSAIGDKEKVEKVSSDEVDLTNLNQEVEIYQQIDPTGSDDAAEEQEVQADLNAELPSLENIIEQSSPEVAHKSSTVEKEIKSFETEEADGKETADAFANEPDRTENTEAAADCDGHSDLIAILPVSEKADEQISSYLEALTANEQDVPSSSKEAEIYQGQEIGVSEIVSPDGLADLIDAPNSIEKDEDDKLGTDADGVTNPEIATTSLDQAEQDSTPVDAAAEPVLSGEFEASFSNTSSESIVPPAATSDDITPISDVTAGGYDPEGAISSETESIHAGISAIQKEENFLLPETEALASISATPVAIVKAVSIPFDIQEKVEGQDLFAISDDAAPHKADFQDTIAVPVLEEELIVPVQASNVNVETPILEKSTELESHEAVRSISNYQEGGSMIEKISNLETNQAGALLKVTDKGSNVELKDMEEKETLDETKEVTVPAFLQTELKNDASDTGDSFAPVIGNVPVVLETLKSGTFKELPDEHEQAHRQSNEVGIEKDQSDLIHNGVDSKLTSSSAACEPGHDEETSEEQPSSVQNSVSDMNLLDLNGERVLMKPVEGDNLLSGKEEIVSQGKSSTEVIEDSTRELGPLQHLIKQISENHFEEEVKDKRLVVTNTSETLSVDNEEADPLKSVTAEPATAVCSEKLAKVPILPVSTAVTSSFLDAGHPANDRLEDAEQILEKPQGTTGSGNGVPTQSKSEVSSERFILRNIEETSQTSGSNSSKDNSHTETHTTNGNLPDKALGVVYGGSPATDGKPKSQVKVEEEKTKAEVSFPWSILLCCSSIDR
ncbi:hypothetical protein O6H91_21G063300 [Diphasiastrum complanatum]|uniref:Uncharacterized protein n=1 Tax=Diphasiastrum complanatum TaxID=34168 RepID=A0ACC2AMW4_DIPCM|nr:hypothetical protein O6H91_21G063300 [Diphasiastrum complanatum]